MKKNADPIPGSIRLNDDVLRPGDIILTTQASKLSAAIRAATFSDISHAMVYVEDRSVIDATSDGVQSRNTQRLLLDPDRPVYALRLKDAPSPAQLKAITLDLRSKIGTRYSEVQAALSVVPAMLEADRQQFCSRLVAQAFAAAGIKLAKNPDFCSPGTLKRSKLLKLIANATLPVTEAEVEHWKTIPDIPQLMRDSTNALLDGVRDIKPTAETLEDIAELLVAHPEHDEHVCVILKSSGYLNIWQIERDKNPWQYDLYLMRSEPDGAMRDYCWSVLQNETQDPNRYVQNRAAYDGYVRHHPRLYFQMMVDLHETLATLHAQRIDVAQRWLEDAGDVPAYKVTLLVPHTSEWFEAFQHWSPSQAMMTRAVIARAGRSDICSICGDDPAKDYRLEEAQRPPNGVDTLRLCDVCLQIRRTRGELFVRIDERPR